MLINTLGNPESLPSLNLYTGASANITNWIGRATMKINLEEGKVKCYERKTSEHLAELGVSCPIMKKRHGHCAESDIWSLTGCPQYIREIFEL